jgi:hypothetical protein
MRSTTCLIVLLLGLAPACSSGGGGRSSSDASSTGGTTTGTTGTTGANAGDLKTVRDGWVKASCDAIESCFGQAAASFGFADCEGSIGPIFDEITIPTLEQGIEKGTVVLDTSNLSACIGAISASCDFLAALPEACNTVVVGQLAAGEVCVNPLECAPGTFCDTQMACPGTCTAKVGDGQPCGVAEACESGLTCTDDVCATPLASGAACGGENANCAPGTTCIPDANDPTGETGSCTPFNDLFTASIGSACNPLAGTLCQPGGACALQADLQWTCENRVNSGNACKIAVPNHCPDDETCGASGQCEKLPALDTACLTGEGVVVQCAPGLTCISSTCQQQVSIGETCSDEDFCFSGACDSGQCVAPAFDTCAN